MNDFSDDSRWSNELLNEPQFMTSMKVGSIEHILAAYDEDTGYGVTFCFESVGPCDLGPNLEQDITCVVCLRNYETEKARGQSQERGKR